MSRLALTSVLCLPAMLAAIATADAPLRLNEIRLEQPGADNDEYIELAGAPGESLAGVAIVVIGDDDSALPGQQNGYVEEVIRLDGFSIAASGFFLIGEPTLSLAIPNLPIALNLEGNDNVTVFVVRGYTGAVGQDLDANDDGVLDSTPWTSVISSLAIVQTNPANGAKSDFFYSTTTVGPEGTLAPSAAWLCSNQAQWIVGSQDPLASGAQDTPGAANRACALTGTRINEARIDARRQGREIADGELVTACQQACPTQAIVFGNINDKESKVAKLKELETKFTMLDPLNTKPRTSYLVKLTNPNPELAGEHGVA